MNEPTTPTPSWLRSDVLLDALVARIPGALHASRSNRRAASTSWRWRSVAARKLSHSGSPARPPTD